MPMRADLLVRMSDRFGLVPNLTVILVPRFLSVGDGSDEGNGATGSFDGHCAEFDGHSCAEILVPNLYSVLQSCPFL